MFCRSNLTLHGWVELDAQFMQLVDEIHRFYGIPAEAGYIGNKQHIHLACGSSIPYLGKTVSVEIQSAASILRGPGNYKTHVRSNPWVSFSAPWGGHAHPLEHQYGKATLSLTDPC
jgi:hypothetical protein